MMLSSAEKGIVTTLLSIYLYFRLEDPWNSLLPTMLGLLHLGFTLHRRCFWKRRGIKFVSAIPFWGDLSSWQLRKEPHVEMWDRYVKKLGNCFGYFQDDTPVLCISDPDLIMEVLKDKSCLINGIANQNLLRNFIGYVLPRLNDDEWKRTRLIALSWFNKKYVKQQVPKVQEVCINLMKDVDVAANAIPNGRPISIRKLIFPHIMDIMAICMTNQPVSFFKSFQCLKIECETPMLQDEKHRNDIASRFPVLTRLFQSLKLFSVLPHYEMSFATKFYKELDQVSEMLQDFQENENDCLLQVCMKKLSDHRDKNSNKWKDIEKEHVYAQIFTAVTRTVEVMADTLQNTMFQLAKAKNANAQNKCYQEAKEYFQNVENKKDNEEFNEAFEYQRACMFESLRLQPNLIRLVRTCEENFPLSNGVTIPKHCLVDMYIYNIFKDPKYFNSPSKFIPERLSDRYSIENNRRLGNYLNFGFGVRQCPGEMLNSLLFHLILSHILVKYELRVENGKKGIHYTTENMMSVVYDDNVKFILIPRSA